MKAVKTCGKESATGKIGIMLEKQEIFSKVESLVTGTENERNVIDVLQKFQAEFGWVPPEAMERASEKTGIPLVKFYEVATFYAAFSLKPRGRHVIRVCTGTACHVRGADKVLEELKRQLDVETGQTTPDGRFTLEVVNCVGACALGPVLVIGDDYHGKMEPRKVKSILRKYP